MPIVKFKVADIMSLPDNYADGCDMVFTDPPWEDRMVKFFDTASKKVGGLSQSSGIDGILNKLFKMSPKVPMFIEYSIQGHERVIHHAERNGHVFNRTIRSTQTNGKPYCIIQFNSDMPLVLDSKGFDILHHAIEHHRPKRIFEPFAGHGVHAFIMHSKGCEVVAAELNKGRAAKLMAKFGLDEA